jgi:hypothetical protein
MGSQRVTVGCSAVGGMEWQVLLFDTVTIKFINYLKLRISIAFSLAANLSEIIIYIQILGTKMQPGS